MALKVLMLRKKLSDKRKELEDLRNRDQDFAARSAELEASIEEASTQEEREAVESEIEKYERESQGHDEAKAALEEEIAGIETEIREIEAKSPEKEKKQERKVANKMENRAKFFGMTFEQRDAFFAREDVKDFLSRTRELATQKRAVTGAELLIPDVMLGLIRENIQRYSKLIGKVAYRHVPGKARQNIMGAIPEAVWTEACGKINEVSLVFNPVEVDGYKVGGYIAVCNAILEDSDIALASEIISALGQAIGYALDKAIIYGTGTKMPLGFVTRLAQTDAPSDYPANAREWIDLSATNIRTIDAAKSGIALFQEIVRAAGAAKGKYSMGSKLWIMNEATKTTLMAEAMSISAAGAIVSGQGNTMPVIGGDIITLDFVPDNNILGGYGDEYLLVERAGTTISQSEHAAFLDDATLFKGTARYDGEPMIAEGFVAIGIGGAAPTTSMSFASDTANP